ncbi:hypothetical protein O181_082428 [Austropuccinia psidii MF-1]|uniref:Tf2-1-like SH3-like domain-containing protein n=1 Tax=Austropuccinia psidii MF-1 TaxID=1389203 RepID=A0A9Q3FRR5_9BASI|nr:hypothetical protein [Austropuccinia psidii MF-1]
MEDSFSHAKDKWDKSHTTSELKVGDLILLSTTKFNNIKGLKKLKDSFAGTFAIKTLNGKNAVEVELSEEKSNKHTTFPVSLIKPHKAGDSERFSLRNNVSQNLPPVGTSFTNRITKILKEIKERTKKVREYLLRYSYPSFEDEWFKEKELPEATKLLRGFRHTKNRYIKN